MDSQCFSEDDLVAIWKEPKTRKKSTAAAPQVRLGIVSEVFGDDEDSSSDDADSEASALKPGQMRVQWYPTGREERLSQDGAKYKPILVDRGFRQGAIVSRSSDKHQIGTVIDINVIGDLLLLPEKKFVIKDADLNRTEFLSKFDPFAEGLFVLFEDWVGSVSSVSYRLTLRSKNGYRCQIVTDNNEDIVEDTSYRLNEGSTFDNIQWYKGLKVLCNYSVLKQAEWLARGVPPVNLRKKIDRFATSSADKSMAFTIEEVELEEVKLRWEHHLEESRVETDDSTEPIKSPPSRKIAKDDIWKLTILDHFQHHVAEIGDRIVGKMDPSNVIVSYNEWSNDLNHLFNTNDASKRLSRFAISTRPQVVVSETKTDNADHKLACLTLSRGGGVSTGANSLTTVSDLGDEQWLSTRNSEVDLDKFSTMSQAGSAMTPARAIVERNRMGPTDELADDVAKAFAGASKQETAQASARTDTAQRTHSKTATLRCKSKVAFKTRAKWQLNGRRKSRRSMTSAASAAAQAAKKRLKLSGSVELDKPENVAFVGELVLVHSYVDVMWQNGTVERGILSTELCHQEYDIDHQNFAMPGSFVQLKLDDGTLFPKSTISGSGYGMVHKVDNEQRLAVVSFFENREHLKTKKVSLFDLVEHRELGQSLQLVGELVTALTPRLPLLSMLGQIVGYAPEEGKVKVKWFDGKETSESPNAVSELSWNGGCAGGVEDSDADDDEEDVDGSDAWETASSSSEEDDWSNAPTTFESSTTAFDNRGTGHQLLDMATGILATLYPLEVEINATADDISRAVGEIEQGGDMRASPLKRQLVESVDQAVDSLLFAHKLVFRSDEWRQLTSEITKRLDVDIQNRTDAIVEEVKQLNKDSKAWMKGKTPKAAIGGFKGMEIMLKIGEWLGEVKQVFLKIKDCAEGLKVTAEQDAKEVAAKGTGDTDTSLCSCPSASAETAETTQSESIESVDPEVKNATAEPTRRFVQLEVVPTSHRFSSDAFEASAATRHFLKAVRNEICLLQNSLPGGIYVIAYEDRMDLYSCMMVGPEGTPFLHGLYFFDLKLPAAYPNVPPLVFYKTLSPEQLNPNLYQDGKVCLSLLGTWDGDDSERWNPGSNLLQVLVSIQGLILTPEPYFNEAGYESRKTLQESLAKSKRYNEMALIGNLEALVRVANSPIACFEADIKQHLSAKGTVLIKELNSWLEGDGEVKCDFPLLPISEGCKVYVRRLVQKLQKALDARVQ